MGKGDKKSKRGKIIKGSYGVRRKRKSGKAAMKAPAREVVSTAAVPAEKEAATVKKTTRTTSAKTTAKSTARTAVKKTEKETKPEETKTAATKTAAKKPATKKPAAKAKKTDTGKEEK
jgi:ribosomal small subunit protein bTHX